MRHRRHFRRLNRRSEHRLALRRNMAQSFVEHGAITTTIPKVKTIRPFIEKLLTLAVRAHQMAKTQDQDGVLAARRQIHKLLSDRALIPAAHQSTYNQMSDSSRSRALHMASGRRYRTGEPKGRMDFTAESVTHRLIESMAPRLVGRPGGYTRMIRLATTRLGDASPLAQLQILGNEIAPMSLTRPKKSARRRRADSRYGLAIKLTKESAARVRSAPPESKSEASAEQS